MPCLKKNIDYMQCGGSGMFIPDPGSDFFPSRIPDPNCLHLGSRILIKEFKYFKKRKKRFLSSKKYDPGCSSRIPDPDADFLPSRIPDPGVKKAPNPGSRIRIRNTEYMYNFEFYNPQIVMYQLQQTANRFANKRTWNSAFRDSTINDSTFNDSTLNDSTLSNCIKLMMPYQHPVFWFWF
jgi:hypothetical protein